MGRHDSAMQTFRRDQAIREALVEAFPEDPRCLDTLAQFLSARLEPEFQDSARAVALTDRAFDLAPEDGDVWETWGKALYREGHFAASITALEKSFEYKDRRMQGLLYLALAHGQTGEHEQARTAYAEAVQWAEGHNETGHWGFRSVRAEAAALLGIEDEASGKEAAAQDE